MSSKINIFKILFSILLFIPINLYADLTLTDSVLRETSGIKTSYYDVERCSPHYTDAEVSDIFDSGDSCQKGFFYKNGATGVLTYKGEYFVNGNVGLNPSLPGSTRGPADSIIDLFEGVDNVTFEGEGTYTITVVLLDYANNASSYEFTYKIDKTAPQFTLNGISENTPYTYVPTDSLARISGLTGGIVKYDSASNSSNHTDEYSDPNIIYYSGSTPEERTSHIRQDLYSFYFRDQSDNKDFNLSLAYSDNYNGYLSSSPSGSLVSGERKLALMSETGDTAILPTILKTTSVSLSTNNLTDNGSENSQEKYRLRLYDNTVGKGGTEDSNYSEVIFYVVRDNEKPNMGGNGLASTSDDATKEILKLSSSLTSWDEDADESNPEVDGAVSKFISANNNKTLYSSVSDIGITGGLETYEWYNAGLDMTDTLDFKIQNANTPTNYDSIFTFNNRFENNNISDGHDFSKVDNNRENGYRKYLTQFESNGELPGVCDAVGNCLEPEIDFRVVANDISKTNSNISLNFGNNPLTLIKPIFANGTDKYVVKTELKDEYFNAIVGVTASENGDKEIKKVNTSFEFYNGLNANVIGKNGSGNKLVTVTDNETDNDNGLTNIGAINSSGIISFGEEPENTSINNDRGTYSFNVVSKVPTRGIYPYLSDTVYLKLNKMNFEAEEFDTTNVGVDDLGIFSDYLDLTGTSDNLLSYSTGFFNNPDYTIDLEDTLKNDYGKIELDSIGEYSYNDFSIKKIELEYAPLFVYGAEDLTLDNLVNNIGQTANHTKKTYKLDSAASNTSIFEKYLPSYSPATDTKTYTSGYFNIYSNLLTVADSTYDNSIINSGTGIIVNNDLDTEYKVKSSPIESDYLVNGYSFNMGYVSYVSYNVGGDTIKIPSISRNVSGESDPLEEEDEPGKNSYPYFPEDGGDDGEGDYEILGDPILNMGLLSSMGIAITGLSNNADTMIIDTYDGTKANVNIGENLSAYDLIATFKENIFRKSAGINWCTNIPTIDDLNDNIGDCTIEIEGEKISFIKGNIEIDCGGNGICELDTDSKRTIIVQDGSTYINSNISTYGKDSQFFIGTIANAGLKNINIPTTDNPDLTRDDTTYGWTFINPSITNIDAFIFSQGPMVSYDGTKLFNIPSAENLDSQLHIFGSILSLNTTGGYKSETESKCPYIIDKSDCDSKTAFIFDLVTLRRYSLEGSGNGDNVKVSGVGKRSGRNDGELPTDGGNPAKVTQADTFSPDGLRWIEDLDYIIYPLFVERDNSWALSPSIFSSSE